MRRQIVLFGAGGDGLEASDFWGKKMFSASQIPILKNKELVIEGKMVVSSQELKELWEQSKNAK